MGRGAARGADFARKKHKRPTRRAIGGPFALNCQGDRFQLQTVLRGLLLAAAAAGRFTSRRTAGRLAAAVPMAAALFAATDLAALRGAARRGATAARLGSAAGRLTGRLAAASLAAAVTVAAALLAALRGAAARLASAAGGRGTGRRGFAARGSTARRFRGTTRGLATATAKEARLGIRGVGCKQTGDEQGRQHKTFHGERTPKQNT